LAQAQTQRVQRFVVAIALVQHFARMPSFLCMSSFPSVPGKAGGKTLPVLPGESDIDALTHSLGTLGACAARLGASTEGLAAPPVAVLDAVRSLGDEDLARDCTAAFGSCADRLRQSRSHAEQANKLVAAALERTRATRTALAARQAAWAPKLAADARAAALNRRFGRPLPPDERRARLQARHQANEEFRRLSENAVEALTGVLRDGPVLTAAIIAEISKCFAVAFEGGDFQSLAPRLIAAGDARAAAAAEMPAPELVAETTTDEATTDGASEEAAEEPATPEAFDDEPVLEAPAAEGPATEPAAPTASCDGRQAPDEAAAEVRRPPAISAAVDHPPAASATADHPPAASATADRPPAATATACRPPAISVAACRPAFARAASAPVGCPPAVSVPAPPSAGTVPEIVAAPAMSLPAGTVAAPAPAGTVLSPLPELAPTETVVSGAALRFAKGAEVEIWSASKEQWVAGVVEEVFEADGMSDGYRVPAGVVKVSFGHGMRFVRPEQIAAQLRHRRAAGGGVAEV